ncbi:hypothetical protein K437DRAFT_91056 [Tilletiaria anomala UBC 951]|uniref:Uncharacterized protein n=1 Tax=Tilletiaria anomala (strain ATCC 24038 / CBS 436.72 / UBC 951) TaxID=1037660 RepID=A0A066WAB4_TILAU|nr:uncharacterized protein K437DRAFT_91056 [Tilletiaria anomala UBC 951]KDN47720.1 hypothetical protein K437DRAFT_91056 [Tilletiaria anomala UBC 951]
MDVLVNFLSLFRREEVQAVDRVREMLAKRPKGLRWLLHRLLYQGSIEQKVSIDKKSAVYPWKLDGHVHPHVHAYHATWSHVSVEKSCIGGTARLGYGAERVRIKPLRKVHARRSRSYINNDILPSSRNRPKDQGGSLCVDIQAVSFILWCVLIIGQWMYNGEF